MSFWRSAWDWIRGDSTGANIARTAGLVFGASLLNRSLDNSSNTPSGSDEREDPGVRLQLNPSTQNRIPVLYGQAAFGGDIVDVELSSDYKTIRYCLVLAELTGNRLSDSQPSTYTFNNVYLNNNRVLFKSDGVTVDFVVDSAGNQDISARDLIKIYMYAGTPLQPQGYSGTTPAAHTVMEGWTSSSHPMTGLIYAIVEVRYNRARGVTGIPDCKFQITNSLSLPGDVLNDYMTNTRYGADIASGDLDSSFVDLNTYASTGFTFLLPNGTSSTTEYRINGLVDTSNVVMQNMENLAAAANSWISYDIHQGKWTTVINQPANPVATFDDSNLLGEVSISGTALSQLNSSAEVQFQNSTIQDAEDFVRVSIPGNQLKPNEPGTTVEIQMPYINRQALALRVGLQTLKQGRVDKIINLVADYSYINVRAGDVIAVNNAQFDYTNKLFRVITAEESEGEDGDLTVILTALEYDPDVYEFDIQEFEVETNDGLQTIGAIGVPGTPTFLKTERDARPRIEFSSVSPFGVVEALEFWITNDVNLPEAQRTYRLLSTRYPVELQTETWPEGTTVTFEEDQLVAGDFLVKTRGINAIVAGPFSQPSGLIEYVPEQITDTIGPDTQVKDPLGNILGTIALLELLLKLFDLFQGNEERSLFERIFDIFKDETGVDIVEDAKTGDLEPKLEVQDDGASVSTDVRTMNFGGGLVVSGSGDTVTINLTAIPVEGDPTELGNFIEFVDCPTAANYGDTVTVSYRFFYQDRDKLVELPYEITGDFDPSDITSPTSGNTTVEIQDGERKVTQFNIETADLEQTETTTVNFTIGGVTCSFDLFPTAVIIEPPVDPEDPEDPPCLLTRTGTLPPDKSSWTVGDCAVLQPLVPETGPYYMTFAIPPRETFVIESIKRVCSGDSTFTLVFNQPAQALIGDIKFINKNTNEVDATVDVTTGTYSDTEATFPIPGVALADISCYDIEIEAESIGTIPEPAGSLQTGTGSVRLFKSDGTLAQTIPASSLSIFGTTVSIPFADRELGTDYYVTMDQGVVTYFNCESPRINSGTVWNFTLAPFPTDPYEEPEPAFIEIDPLSNTETTFAFPRLAVCRWDVCVDPYSDESPPPQGFIFDPNPLQRVNIRSNALVQFSRNITIKPDVPAPVELYENGSLWQTFDLRQTFAEDQIGEIYQIGTNVIRINPTRMMKPGRNYYILIPPGTVIDTGCQTEWPGITDPNLIAWKTDGAEISESTIPDDPFDGEIELEFDREVTPGEGTINIYDDQENLIAQIPSDDPAVTFE